MAKNMTEKSDTFQKPLPVRLSDDELRHRGEALSAEMKKLDEIEAEVVSAKEVAKPLRMAAEIRVMDLRNQIDTKHEERLTDCYENKHFDQRCAETVRMDTGEVVETRPLTAREMQSELSIVKGLKPGQAPAKPGTP